MSKRILVIDEEEDILEGVQLTSFIRSKKAARVGSAALAFKQMDSNGNMFNLKQLKGKFVLIDFWAST